MNEVKRYLIGEPAFFGNEKFLHFGTEVHRAILEPEKEPSHTFNNEEMERITAMTKAAKEHPNVKYDLARSDKEQSVYGYIEGVKFRIILDMQHTFDCPVRFGADLKTTSVRTEAAFMKSAREYGYFRQVYVYKTVGGLDVSRIYALQKKAPFSIYTIDSSRFIGEMIAAEEEVKMLISIIKKSGRFN